MSAMDSKLGFGTELFLFGYIINALLVYKSTRCTLSFRILSKNLALWNRNTPQLHLLNHDIKIGVASCWIGPLFHSGVSDAQSTIIRRHVIVFLSFAADCRLVLMYNWLLNVMFKRGNQESLSFSLTRTHLMSQREQHGWIMEGVCYMRQIIRWWR